MAQVFSSDTLAHNTIIMCLVPSSVFLPLVRPLLLAYFHLFFLSTLVVQAYAAFFFFFCFAFRKDFVVPAPAVCFFFVRGDVLNIFPSFVWPSFLEKV